MTWRFSQMLRAVEDIALKQFSYVVIVWAHIMLVCVACFYSFFYITA